jgi:Fe2+ transport system protein B
VKTTGNTQALTLRGRILGTPKERLIAITLLALGVPCSAQLATIMGILGGISVWASPPWA